MGKNVNVTVVGDSDVGKSRMLYTYMTNAIIEGYDGTIFQNYQGKIKINNKIYDLHLHDTKGKDDFDKRRLLIYKKTDCFLLCFSIDSHCSFESINKRWISHVRHYKPNTPILLIGMKNDLRYDIYTYCLNIHDGIRMQKMIGAEKYLECSSIMPEDLDNVFQEAVQVVLKTSEGNMRKCSII